MSLRKLHGLPADTQPHFTTIANFISGMREEFMPLFLEVLMICDAMEVIRRKHKVLVWCAGFSKGSVNTNKAKRYNFL